MRRSVLALGLLLVGCGSSSTVVKTATVATTAHPSEPKTPAEKNVHIASGSPSDEEITREIKEARKRGVILPNGESVSKDCSAIEGDGAVAVTISGGGGQPCRDYAKEQGSGGTFWRVHAGVPTGSATCKVTRAGLKATVISTASPTKAESVCAAFLAAGWIEQ